jgi:hypothetical protein
MLDHIRTRIAISRVCRLVASCAARRNVSARVDWLGAYYLDPKHLCIIVQVDSDQDKRQLLQDHDFQSSLRAALDAAAYPSEARDAVTMLVESEETVARDFGGRWQYRLKS